MGRLDDVTYAAVHEAGHFVAALALGLDPGGAAISADGKHGITTWDTAAGTAKDQAVAALAGLVATTIAGDHSPVVDEPGDDLEKLEGFLQSIPEAEWAEIGERTFELIKSRWALVMLVAGMIAANGEVVRGDVRQDDATFGLLARTTLPPSVYHWEVTQDAPVAWWRLGNPAVVTSSGDQVGTRTLEFVDNPRGGQVLVTGESSDSTLFDHPEEGSGNVAEAAHTTPIPSYPFTIEAVFRSAKQTDDLSRTLLFIGGNNSGGNAQRWVEVFIRETGIGDPGGLSVFLTDDGGATSSQATGFPLSLGRVDTKRIHHVAIVVESSTELTIFVDGADETDSDSTKSVSLPTGTVQVALGNVGDNYPTAGEFGLDGELCDVAIYDYVLSSDRIAAHSDAVFHPWQGDQPGERINRILDLIGFPADMREIDAGNVELQSAMIGGQTALEHIQKVGETEFGNVFMPRSLG